MAGLLPRTGRKPCICTQGACCTNEGTVSLPSEPERRAEWFAHLGVDETTYNNVDGRVDLCHFPVASVVAATVVDPNGHLPNVGIADGAVPVNTEEDILQARRGSCTALLRARAQLRSFKSLAQQQRAELAAKEQQISALTDTAVAGSNEALREARATSGGSGRGGGEDEGRASALNYEILRRLDEERATALCGMCSLRVFEVRLGCLVRVLVCTCLADYHTSSMI